jgi:pimeloyl-ACP methyl ester carboxylesterase
VALGGVVKAVVVSALVGCASSSAPAHHYADINGLHMYYETQGEGPPLLLLHGGGSTAQTTFGAIMPKLARTHRVIAPEQQGHGHTADVDRPLSFEQMADDSAELLRTLDVKQVDVIGFSSGGIVAMQLVLRHPELVRRLVLCSTIYAREGFPDAVWKSFDHPDAAQMPAVLRDAYLAVAPHPEALQTIVEKSVAMMRGFSWFTVETLRGIENPALVMSGDADLSPAHSAELARILPHAQLAILPDAGHGTYLGAAEAAKPGSVLPDITVTLIESFLR